MKSQTEKYIQAEMNKIADNELFFSLDLPNDNFQLLAVKELLQKYSILKLKFSITDLIYKFFPFTRFFHSLEVDKMIENEKKKVKQVFDEV